MFPPPTDNTNRQSFIRFDTLTNLRETTIPSFIIYILAVNSETLSEILYASMLQSFLKSFTKWLAFAALPPTPKQKTLPPFSC